MNRREEGFLLLTGSLGDPNRRPLTAAELRKVKQCVINGPACLRDKELEPGDLTVLGCPPELAEKTVSLLGDQKRLDTYMEQGRAKGCVPLTRISRDYPSGLIAALGDSAPGSLWLKGDHRLLNRPAVALVGSRELEDNHADFARRVGVYAARQGYVLISGNARGADTEAQESCLAAGGKVISVIADRLLEKKPRPNVLYISEGGFDMPFSAHRAHSRNRLIHSMGQRTFVARCSCGVGGTWKGTAANLKGGWSPVFAFSDGSEGAYQLQNLGATLITPEELWNIFNG